MELCLGANGLFSQAHTSNEFIGQRVQPTTSLHAGCNKSEQCSYL